MPLTRLQIVIIDPLSPGAVSAIEDVGDVCYLPTQPEAEVRERLRSADVLVIRSRFRLTPEWVAGAPRLKAVVRAGSGVDNLPLETFAARDIRFTNLPDASTPSVAELGVAAMLFMMRNLYEGHSSLMKGQWKKAALLGNELYGKTVGLVGFGRIGKQLALRLKSFDVRMLYCNRSGGGVHPESGAVPTSYERLLAESDVISLQVPLLPDTRHMFNRAAFGKMARRPFLVNLGRYDLVEMSDLREAVVAGRIRGAVIDPVEPDRRNFEAFADLPVFFLPHLGATTIEAQDRLGVHVRDTLIEWGLGPRAGGAS
ncbi:hypothetical protein HUW63_36200 [Myxococcus sp. AM001]|nr:hypothetical protein [Myxococcus sp. AM001]